MRRMRRSGVRQSKEEVQEVGRPASSRKVEVGVGGEYVTCLQQRSRAGGDGRRLMWREQRDGRAGVCI